MFPGELVVVRKYEKAGRDPYGAPLTVPQEMPLANVLVAPGITGDLGADRPEGVDIKYTLCIPKSYTETLEGADIKIRGEWYSVVGSPGHYDAGFCPTQWNRSVEVGVVHG